MTTFLDVGAHRGQTLQAVVGRFDRVVAFEPMRSLHAALVEEWGDRVELHRHGLGDRTGRFTLFGTNDQMEASLYPDKRDVDETATESVWVVRASEWFSQHVGDDEMPVVKLNCEGSETAIVNDLIDTGLIWRVGHMMVDFDVRKIPSKAKEERALRRRLSKVGFDRWVESDEVMVGATHQDRIGHWLDGKGY